MHPLDPLYRRLERLDTTPRLIFLVSVYVPLAVAAVLCVAIHEAWTFDVDKWIKEHGVELTERLVATATKAMEARGKVDG